MKQVERFSKPEEKNFAFYPKNTTRKTSFLKITNLNLIKDAKVAENGREATIEFTNKMGKLQKLKIHQACAFAETAEKIYKMLNKGAKALKVTGMDYRDTSFAGYGNQMIERFELIIEQVAGNVGATTTRKPRKAPEAVQST